MTQPFCDPETGNCTPQEEGISKHNDTHETNVKGTEIIYVGDPMCSWCWGIAPELQALKEYYKKSIPFKIIVGGLRPGGGDAWNKEMKDFLRHHWEEIEARTGQPFGYQLLDLPDFNYDTEPACRALVAARMLAPALELDFFEHIQKNFYVHSKDPKKVGFYKNICDEFSIDFNAFKALFFNNQLSQMTNDEFVLNRKWGVRGYPSILLKHDEKLYRITNGYAKFEDMKAYINELAMV